MPQNLDEGLLRRKLMGYLTGKTSLSAFRSWFVPATWDPEEMATDRLRELVGEVKLRLAEYSAGHWSRSELRAKLLPIVNSYHVGVETKPRGGASATTLRVSQAPNGTAALRSHQGLAHRGQVYQVRSPQGQVPEELQYQGKASDRRLAVACG